jgi:mRNA interferase MazF
MKTKELKLARIGNSRGVRLPASSLKRYAFGSAMIMEERTDGILLRPVAGSEKKLSWEDTAREMTRSRESWSEWRVADADGLDAIPWEPGGKAKVAEKRPPYGRKPAVRGRAIRRYEIRWADLDPAQGAETAKARPVVIVSLDAFNERLETVTVCPVTSRIHSTWRGRMPVRCAGRPAEIAVDQIRTVSRSRIGARLGSLSEEEAAALRRLITEMYGE